MADTADGSDWTLAFELRSEQGTQGTAGQWHATDTAHFLAALRTVRLSPPQAPWPISAVSVRAASGTL